MDKKRALLVNLLTVGAVLLLVLVTLFVSKLMPRRITPNAGPLEIEFEPSVTMQTAKPSAHLGGCTVIACKEDIAI